MNTELQIAGASGQALADMMGVSTQSEGSSKKSSNLARLNITHTSVMGDIEVAGKLKKMEVLPVGTFRLKINDTFVYCLAPEIRIFALKEQWTHWDSLDNVMYRTVMANNLYGDLKDSKGTFNIGRPSGYYSKKEYDALSQEIKDLMRSVKRTKILFGTINFNGAAIDEAGNDVSGYDGQIPFILDIKNKDSINALKDVLEQIKNDSTVPIEAKLLKRSLTLSSKIESVPQTYATILFTLKGATDLADEDSKTFESFQDWIKWSDGYVLDRWKENNTQELNEADAELVDAFVDVEGVGV
jgi:hypothetical protein